MQFIYIDSGCQIHNQEGNLSFFFVIDSGYPVKHHKKWSLSTLLLVFPILLILYDLGHDEPLEAH